MFANLFNFTILNLNDSFRVKDEPFHLQIQKC